jgi:hypothetical protein
MCKVLYWTVWSMSTSLLSGVLLERRDCFSAFRFHHAFQRCLNPVGGSFWSHFEQGCLRVVSQFKCPKCPHKYFVSLMSHGKRVVKWCKLLEHSFMQNFLMEELLDWQCCVIFPESELWYSCSLFFSLSSSIFQLVLKHVDCILVIVCEKLWMLKLILPLGTVDSWPLRYHSVLFSLWK